MLIFTFLIKQYLGCKHLEALKTLYLHLPAESQFDLLRRAYFTTILK